MLPSRTRKGIKCKTQTRSMGKNQITVELEKKYFEEDNNFMDYFMEIGVKPDIFKNKCLYEPDSPEISKLIEPTIITKFPNFDKKNIVIETSMIEQIFPNNFSIIESKIKPKSKFYCIVLDNQLYSAIYTNKYLACLIVYESIESYRKLYNEYKEIKNEDENLRKYSYSGKILRKSKKLIDLNNLYIPKCLCIVSVHDYISKYEKILREIYNLIINNPPSNLFLESMIEKLIIETPKIPKGISKVVVKFPNNRKVELTQNKMNECPSVNNNISKLFQDMKLDIILDVFKYLLYETKMVFFSSDLQKLTNTILSFIFLLSPFKYQFQIVSVVPKNLYKFIETISPYIFGINEKYYDNFIQKNNIIIEDNTLCFVDIDNNTYFIISPGGTLDKKEYPDFPKNLREKLEQKILKYNQEYEKEVTIQKISTMNCENFDEVENNLNEEKSKKYQQIFYEFMIDLLKDYPQFLSTDYSVTKDISMSTKDLINIKNYIDLYSGTEKDFYRKICGSQMFIEFIYKRMMPKDFNDKVEALFFEEKINEKIANNKFFGGSKLLEKNCLLPCEDYNYIDTFEIDLNPDNNNTSKILIDYILSQKPSKDIKMKFLENGYILDIDDEKQNIYFKYHIFPSLLSEKLFILNINSYTVPPKLFNQVNEINEKIVNQSHLKFIQDIKDLKNSKAENDLYLCYLILWSMVLWYTDKEERDYSFLKMLEILEKIEEHDIKIFELVFKALAEYSNDENIVLLYRKFIQFRLNPTWDIFTIVNKIFKKRKNADKKNKLLHENMSIEELQKKYTLEKHKFKERIFRVIDSQDYIFSDNILYHAYIKCKICHTSLNLKELSTNLSLIKTEKDGSEQLKCNGKKDKYCGKILDAKLKFKFGEELFNRKSNNTFCKFYTSVFKSIRFLTPGEIKKKLIDIAVRKSSNNKLNVENFRKIYPEIFWNIIWYFNIQKIDKNFILPYDRLKNRVYKQNSYQKYLQYEQNNQLNENNETNKENKENNNNNQVRKIIDVKNNKNKISIFKKANLKKSYKITDLCIQTIYQFAFEYQKGFVTYKNIFSYEENISYNEIFLIFYEKDNNFSVSNNSLLNGDSESSSSNLLRDSGFFQNPTLRGSCFSGGISAQKFNNIYYNSNNSSVYSGLGSCKITCADSMNSCLIFEQSDGDDEDPFEDSENENENEEV